MNRRGTYARDAGVSNVVGFILIMGIAIGTVAMVFLGGTPTLERIQSGQETQAISASMQGLDQEISSLITGAPASTTPAWRFSMGRGNVALNTTGHIWAFAADLDSNLQFEYGNLHDTTYTELDIKISGASISSPSVDAWHHQGADTSSIGATLSGSGSWASGDTRTLTLAKGMNESSLEVHIKDGSTIKAKVFLIDSGAVIWSSGAGGQLREVAYENTAVIVKQDLGQLLENSPSLQPPKDTGSTSDPKRSIFFRVVKLNGTLAVSGQASATVLLDSQGNHARFSDGDVERVSIYPPPRYDTVWTRLLDDDNRDYPYVVGANSLGQTRAWCDKAAGSTSCDPDGGSLNELAVSIVETGITLEATR